MQSQSPRYKESKTITVAVLKCSLLIYTLSVERRSYTNPEQHSYCHATIFCQLHVNECYYLQDCFPSDIFISLDRQIICLQNADKSAFFHMASGNVSGLLNIIPLSYPKAGSRCKYWVTRRTHADDRNGPIAYIGHQIISQMIFLAKIFSHTYLCEKSRVMSDTIKHYYISQEECVCIRIEASYSVYTVRLNGTEIMQI